MDSNIVHKFESKICILCENDEISLYFDIYNNFIEYNGVYHSLHEILNESLNINIQNGNAQDICLDCKDKAIKFYHFKRKVQETQMKYARNEKTARIPNSQKSVKSKQSKVVQNICEIVRKYTEKCSIGKIRVNENNKKLIIEPNEEHVENESVSDSPSANLQLSYIPTKVKEEPDSEVSDHSNVILWKSSSQSSSESTNLIDFNDVITIKQEPEELPDITFEDYTEKYLTETDNSSCMEKSFEASEHNRPISKAAMKMRKYREKLKLPENREKFLEHKERQKFWNRRHYLRKQARSSRYSKSTRIFNEFDNFFIS